MDQLSLQVLKHLAKQNDSRKNIIEKFGENAKKSIQYLSKEEYISSGQRVANISHDLKPIYTSDENYSITSKGLAYLEDKPGKDFDRWTTRICAIWGAITGTAAIIVEIWLHFL